MSEDVSSTLRVGVTVILVAALIATVLNLMVVSQSILSGGQSTLQSGVDQIGQQEFEAYSQKKVSGVVVKSSLALYEGRDIGVCVRTKACIDADAAAQGAWAFNYGCTLDAAGTFTPPSGGGTVSTVAAALTKKAGDSFYTKNLKIDSGVVAVNNNKKGTGQTGTAEYILDSARFRGELIKDQSGTIVGILFTQL